MPLSEGFLYNSIFITTTGRPSCWPIAPKRRWPGPRWPRVHRRILKSSSCFQVYRSSSFFSISNRFPPPSKPLIPSVLPYSLSFPQHTAAICIGKLSGFSSSGSELPQNSSAEAVVIGTLSYYSQGQICVISGNSKSQKESVTQTQIYCLSALLPKIRPQYTHEPRLQPKTEPKECGSELDDLNCNSKLYKKSLSPAADATLENLSQFLETPGRWCGKSKGLRKVVPSNWRHVTCQLKIHWNGYLYGDCILW